METNRRTKLRTQRIETNRLLLREIQKTDVSYFIEGLQGSGKSTLAGQLSRKLPGYEVFREGDY